MKIRPFRFMRLLPATTAAVLAVVAPGVLAGAAHADPASSTGSALLIANGRQSSLPALRDCEPVMRALGDRLRGKGNDVTEITDPTGPAMRAAIGRFAAEMPPAGRALVVYCGYAMSDSDKLFLLPADAAVTQPADLARQAVIGRAVSRILSSHDALFVAELHAAPGAPSLTSSIQSLREETAPGTRLDVGVAPAPDKSPLIEAFSAQVAAANDWSALVASIGSPDAAPSPNAPASPSPAPPAQPPARPSSDATATAAAKPETPAAPPASAPSAASKEAASAAPPLPASKPPSPTFPPPAASKTEAPAVATGDTADKPAAGDAAVTLPVVVPKPRVRPPVNDGGSPTIRRIQLALLARGLLKGEVTGHTDALTQSAIRTYQSQLGHPVTGFLTYDETNSLEPKSK